MGHSASKQLSATFFLLLDTMQFFDHYHAKRIDVAFEVRGREREKEGGREGGRRREGERERGRERERERDCFIPFCLSSCVDSEAAEVVAGASWRHRGTCCVDIQGTG